MLTETKVLLSFHNDKAIKDKFIERVKAHKKADEIIQGTYWENGKGCAVGCTIHGSNHYAYEKELGLPIWLAFLEDSIFEKLQPEDAKKWPLEFLKAIPVGVNLDPVKFRFLSYLLIDKEDGLLDGIKDDKIKSHVSIVGRLLGLQADRILTDAEVAEGNEAAWAAWAARDAWAAWDAWDARAAWDAWAARDARAARDTRAAWAAWAAWAAYIKKSAKKLLTLLSEAR